MNEEPSEFRSWVAAAVIVAPMAALFFLARSAAARLAAFGVPLTLALFLVVAAGSAAMVLAMVFASIIVGKSPWQGREFKVAAFIWVTMNVLFAAQIAIERLLAQTTLPDEVRYHGSWLAAIVVVGSVAEFARRRLAIEWPSKKSAPN